MSSDAEGNGIRVGPWMPHANIGIVRHALRALLSSIYSVYLKHV